MRAPTTTRSLGHVAVLGGSVAGLLTAHAIAGHAERVTVLERDHYPDEPVARGGVPQSPHTHVLLTSGIRALDELLPELSRLLHRKGAPSLSVPADLGVWQAGQWVSRRHPSEPVVTASRPLLEHLIRHRVLERHPHIDVRTSSRVTGLLGDSQRVAGAVFRERGVELGEQREISADLVIDATGRASRTPEWLDALGVTAPPEEVLATGRAYATCSFRTDSSEPLDRVSGFYIVPDAAQPLGAILLPAEDDRMMVTLSGPRANPPPTDPDGFVEFARGLPHPAPHRWLRQAEPLTRPVGYRHTANRRRRYDRAAGLPNGLLVVGDALCAFNPVYGQGISVAAMNAVALSRELAASGSRLTTRRAQRAVLASARGAWDVATGADSPMPGAEGNALRDGPADGLRDWYLERVRERVPGDPVVCRAFRDVLFLLAPPSSLLTSRRVLLRSLFHPTIPTPDELSTRD
ncbi:2-polyprenyl-6-methoxyphenol hydroxylase-like FAD-dependent oxidoreductase [Actinopolyspora lacussalsi]|nr:2-polyprenyl-6-methoxyphenol hydroxylase-like FAD-dependent oxidoreductase [Actinopolyspora lacussalsi]